jgi:DNA primase
VIIPDDKIAEVRERAGIVEVISDYISLRKSGANYQGLCPFHGEKTPSFNVNPGRGIFHCFGCGVGGNAITFVMKMEGLSFPEAVKLLAKRVGVDIQERQLSPTEKRRQDEKGRDLRILSLAAGYYGNLLQQGTEGDPGRRYLEKRGIESTLFPSYRLGYASEKWDGLALFLKQNNIALEQVEKLGLIKKKSSGSGYYDLFRNRLIFTIANVHGEPIGFGGRVLDDSLPKYINSPESAVYSKSEVLFGIDLARQAMREERRAIIVEGYFDHLALFRAGIKNVVATCGTALTAGHLQVLKRYAEKIYLLFDGDSAGRKATLRAMELLLAEKVPCFVIEMPNGDDPDSYLASHPAEAFKALADSARPAPDYFLRLLVAQEDIATVAGKKSVADQFRPVLLQIVDPLERDLYVKELSRLIGVDARMFRSEQQRDNREPLVEQKTAGTGAAESAVALLCRYPEIATEFVASGVMALLPAELATVAGHIVTMLTRGEQPDYSQLLEKFAGKDVTSFASIVMDDSHLHDINPFKALDDLRRNLERKALTGMDAKSLRKELQTVSADSPRYMEILETLNDLRNRKSQLS